MAEGLELRIMEVLRRYSSAKIPLTQTQIIACLKQDYGIEVERRVVRRRLTALTSISPEVHFREIERAGDEVMMTDFYVEPPFEDGELRLIIDSLAFSNYLPVSQRRALIEKLKRFASPAFILRSALLPAADHELNEQLLRNVEIIDEAVREEQKIRAKYLEYTRDKKLHARCNGQGTERLYTLNPYQMVMSRGHYYLICNNDLFESLSHYRIDRLTDVQLSGEPRRPLRQISTAYGRTLDTDEYCREHVFMYSGATINAAVKIERCILNHAVDLFGNNVRFGPEESMWVQAHLRTDEQSLVQFAKHYAPHVRIISPKSARVQIRDAMQEMLKLHDDS